MKVFTTQSAAAMEVKTEIEFLCSTSARCEKAYLAKQTASVFGKIGQQACKEYNTAVSNYHAVKDSLIRSIMNMDLYVNKPTVDMLWTDCTAPSLALGMSKIESTIFKGTFS